MININDEINRAKWTMADGDLASAVILSMESTVTYVQSRGETVHPATLQVLSWLKKRQV